MTSALKKGRQKCVVFNVSVGYTNRPSKRRLEKTREGEKKNKAYYNSWEFRNKQSRSFGRRNPVAMGGEAVKMTREIRHN